MRAAFIKALAGLAERDPRVVLLTGDLGYMAIEPFATRFPKRFFNVGVAEQNMVSLATGLAESGFIPFAYSIVPFITLRPYEFIRNGPIQHRLPVRLVGVGGGFEYGTNGLSHYGLEDLGVMRIHPGMTVIAPADHQQAQAAILATWDLPGPIYYRLGKDDKTTVPGLEGRFELGRVEVLQEGNDALIVTVGNLAGEALRAAQILAAESISARVILVSSFNPAPVEDLAQHMALFEVVVTAEAHFVVGGLGSLVCETAAECGIATRVVRCGVKSCSDGISGNQQFLHGRHGLSGQEIAAATLRVLRNSTSWASKS
jgi:transketolase